MRNSTKTHLLTCVVALGLSVAAFADTFSLSSINGGAASGSSFVNFDGLSLGNAPQSAGLADLTFTGNAKVVKGSLTNEYAAPYLSLNNGTGFGSPNQPDGVDTTRYLSVGTGSITFQFASGQTYFGLLWGSVDDYNTLAFFNGDTFLKSYSGLDVWGSANGDQGAAGTFYVNINDLDGTFNRVVATSSTNSFEFDNVAVNSSSRVPDTGATVAMLGLGLVVMATVRRKR